MRQAQDSHTIRRDGSALQRAVAGRVNALCDEPNAQNVTCGVMSGRRHGGHAVNIQEHGAGEEAVKRGRWRTGTDTRGCALIGATGGRDAAAAAAGLSSRRRRRVLLGRRQRHALR